MQEITNILQGITAFNFLSVALILWSIKHRHKNANFFLAFFLLGKSFTLTSNLFYTLTNPPKNEIIIVSVLLMGSFLFFYTPFLWLYTKALCKEKIDLKKTLPHFIPFILYVLLNLYISFNYLWKVNIPWINALLSLPFDFIGMLYYSQAFCYTLLSLRLILKHKEKSKVYISNLNHFRLNWLIRVLALFLLVWFAFFLEWQLYDYFQLPEIANISKLFGIALLLILSNYTVVSGFKSPSIFSNTSQKAVKSSPIALSRVHYDKLVSIMEQKELYLNPDLSLKELSEKLDISTRNTSALIKEHTGSNFYDFVNHYRIEEAKNLLSDDSNMSILQVVYASGFNNKSVFNRLFKEKTGLTPSQFKRGQ